MTDDVFKAMFGTDADELEAALAAAAQDEAAAKEAAEAAKKLAPKKDGIWYDGDEETSNGHTLSRYRVVMGGKVIMWAVVNNTVEAAAKLPGLPAGATCHEIVIQNAHRADSITTNGLAVRHMHEDGVHVDGQSIQAYIVPRIPRLLGQLYGV